MTNIQFLEEHIRQVKEALFYDDMPPLIAESIKTELKYCESILKELKALEIIKPLCEVVETPVRKDRYLKVNGVVVYTFKDQKEYDLLKEVLE